MSALRLAIILAVALTTFGTSAESRTPVDAALDWLQPIDAGLYDKAWQVASAHFQQSISRDHWHTVVDRVRAPLGTLHKREELTTVRRANLPGAPDGDYAIVTFSTEFAHKTDAVETVVLVRREKRWRGDGYFIRSPSRQQSPPG